MPEEKTVVIGTNSKTKEFTSKTGNTYTFQKVAPIEWLDILDGIEDGEKVGQRRRLYSKVLENVVVRPAKKMEDFEEYSEMDEVVTAAIKFQQGK